MQLIGRAHRAGVAGTPSRGHRGRLVYPAVVMLGIGLFNAPPGAAAASPRLAVISAVQLQAASSLVSGLDGAGVVVPAAAVSLPAGVGAHPDNDDAYPPLNRWIASLPVDVRNALLPPLYVAAWVLGAVIGVVMLLVDPLVKLFNPEGGIPLPAAAAEVNSPTAGAVAVPEPASSTSPRDWSAPGAAGSDPGEQTAAGRTTRQRSKVTAAEPPASEAATGTAAEAEVQSVAQAAPVDAGGTTESGSADLAPVASVADTDVESPVHASPTPGEAAPSVSQHARRSGASPDARVGVKPSPESAAESRRSARGAGR